MTALGAIERQVAAALEATLDIDTGVAVRATIKALIDRPPSTVMMLRAGMALGELMKNDPHARPGDWFVAQYKAALKALLENRE